MSPPPFSVLLSVYSGDAPTELDAALDSVLDQTLSPDEVLVVLDGTTTPNLRAVVERYQHSHPDRVKTYALDHSETLGEALRVGVTKCSHDLIARMDADDRSVETRFERQVEYLQRHPDVDAVGGHVAEFETDPDDPERVRRVPTTADTVRTTARTRNPINHPTVMFRREAVLAAGNYRDTNTIEDYDLWARMLANGATLTNLDEVLVHAHGGDDLYDRRGGFNYVRKEVELQRELRRIGLISRPQMAVNLLLRLPIRVLPTSVRGRIYSTLLRDSTTRS